MDAVNAAGTGPCSAAAAASVPRALSLAEGFSRHADFDAARLALLQSLPALSVGEDGEAAVRVAITIAERAV